MRNNPALILSTMDTFAAQQDFLINIGSDKGRIVADLIAEHKPKVSVEMGGYVGYSAIWFADAMRRAASPGTEVKLWSLEYEGRFARIARELVELAGLGDVVEVVVGEAGGSAVKLREEGKIREGEVDFLFLDHVEELYLPDFKIGWLDAKVLRKGALVVADNVVRPGAPEYRAFVRSQDGLSSEGVRGLIIPGDMEVGDEAG